MVPKVSVIILVYNVEKYIERCVRSLFNQTLSEIEYIFVNDCTKDRSIDILHSILLEFPQRKSQVKIINLPKNVGQASARKIGIKAASGEYVIHCDSDDWVSCEAYQILYERAALENSDMIFHDYYVSDGINHSGIHTKIKHLNRYQLLESIISGSVKGSLWLVMIRRELYNNPNFIFPTANMTEDSTMIVQLLFFANNISYIPQKLYYYYINPSSISRTLSIIKCEQRFNDCITNTKLLEEFFALLNVKDFEDYFVIKKIDSISHLLPCIYNRYYYKLWRSAYPTLYADVYRSKHLSKVKKFKYFLVFFRLYPIWHWLCGYDFAK